MKQYSIYTKESDRNISSIAKTLSEAKNRKKEIEEMITKGRVVISKVIGNELFVMQ